MPAGEAADLGEDECCMLNDHYRHEQHMAEGLDMLFTGCGVPMTRMLVYSEKFAQGSVVPRLLASAPLPAMAALFAGLTMAPTLLLATMS